MTRTDLTWGRRSTDAEPFKCGILHNRKMGSTCGDDGLENERTSHFPVSFPVGTAQVPCRAPKRRVPDPSSARPHQRPASDLMHLPHLRWCARIRQFWNT
jgi:hypothetical protein